MATRKVFTDKELKKLTDEYEAGKHTKTALAKSWGIGVPKLTKEVENYKAKLARQNQLKQNKKGTPLSQEEIEDVIVSYTKEHLSMNQIAKQLLRSLGAIRNVLTKNNIPIRSKLGKKAVIGDTTSILEIGDLVYSKRHNIYGNVRSVVNKAYGVWVEERDGFNVKRSFHMFDNRENFVKIKEITNG